MYMYIPGNPIYHVLVVYEAGRVQGALFTMSIKQVESRSPVYHVHKAESRKLYTKL